LITINWLLIAANVACVIVALEHLWFMVLEMFYWDKPLSMRIFRLTPETAKSSKALAANQGLYNGFLAAGIIWAIALGAAGWETRKFFLLCVVVAGVFGAATANRRILLVQALPGAIAFALVYLTMSQ